MKKRNLFLIFSLFINVLGGCSANKTTVGLVGGTAIGTGIGAVAGRTSTSITVPHGMAVGAGAGAVSGLLLTYTSAAAYNYSSLASNDATIEEQNEIIYSNENLLEAERAKILSLESRRDPKEGEYIYLGQTLGNPWR